MKPRKEQNVNNDNGYANSISDYFSTNKTKFTHLLKITSKFKEMYKSEEGKLSILISIISSIVFIYISNRVEIEIFNNLIRNITITIFASLIGMLGFIISGLAILTGTITSKAIKSINEKGMIDNLISILFSFYFIGAFIGVSIFGFILMYILSFPDIAISGFRVMAISFILSYLFSFSIIYSIAQLGTCLRIFLVSYRFMKIDEDNASNVNKD